MKNFVRISPILLAALLTACTTPPPPQAAPDPAPSEAALHQLQQVRDTYEAGNYGDVIRTVSTSQDLASAPVSVRVEALKLQAFSYCVSNYKQLCQDDFSRILDIDPSFELAPAERGHPVWGPVFQQAKAARQS